MRTVMEKGGKVQKRRQSKSSKIWVVIIKGQEGIRTHPERIGCLVTLRLRLTNRIKTERRDNADHEFDLRHRESEVPEDVQVKVCRRQVNL